MGKKAQPAVGYLEWIIFRALPLPAGQQRNSAKKKPDLARFLCFSFNFNAYLPAAGHQVKAAGERSEAQPEAKDKKKKRIKPR